MPKERLPPHSIEAEQSVLGSVMVGPECLTEVASILRPADFYRLSYGTIYEALLALNAAQSGIDLITLSAQLESCNELGLVGGMGELAKLVSATPTHIHATHYARIVKQHSLQRQLIDLATYLVGKAYDGDSDPKDTISGTLSRLFALSDSTNQTKYSWSTVEMVNAAPGIMEARQKAWRDQKRGAYPVTPWPSLAELVPWLKPGMPAIIAGPTGSGKSLIADCLSESYAQSGWNVAFFHYELPTEHLLDRKVARYGNVTMNLSGRGEVGNAIDKVAQAVASWEGNLQYIHVEGWPISRLVGEAEALWRARLCDVIVLDYLQKAPFIEHVRGATTAQMAGNDVNLIKNFCERRNVAAILVSQYNNAGDLRNSGEYRQFVNVVIELVKLGNDQMKVKVTKNTGGRTGDCTLTLDYPRYRVLDKAKPEVVPYWAQEKF